MSTPCDLLAAAAEEYLKGAQSLESFSKKMDKKLGASVPDDVKAELFRRAAEQFRKDHRQVEDIKMNIARVMAQEAWKHASVFEKAKAGVNAAVGTGRALLTSFDISAPFRQGALLSLSNPKRAFIGKDAAAASMIKAMLNPEVADRIDISLKHRANSEMYKESGLFLADPHNGDKAEEAFAYNLAERIPLGIGKAVGASERAYTTYLNVLRADTFDAFVRAHTGRHGEVTPEEARAYASFINEATGRGEGKVADALSKMSGTLFAPRYLASRLNVATGKGVFHGEGNVKTKMMVAQTYVQFLGALGSMYVLSELNGGDVEKDPRSANFGKIRFKNIIVDPTGGLSQFPVLVARLFTGQTKPQQGGIAPAPRYDTLRTFARGKLAPVPGSVIDFMSRTDKKSKMNPQGAPYGANLFGSDVSKEGGAITNGMKFFGVEAPRAVRAVDYYFSRNAVPMGFSDIAQAATQEGLSREETLTLSLMSGALTTVGMGVRTLNNDERKMFDSNRPPTIAKVLQGQSPFASEKKKGRRQKRA